MKLAMVCGKKQFGFIVVALCCLFVVAGFSEQKPDEKPDLSQPAQSFYSPPLERFNSGFVNVLSGPIEPINRLREEVKRTDPVRGFVPGVLQGLRWFAVREAVGIYEMVTFTSPKKPHLEPIDVDWLTA